MKCPKCGSNNADGKNYCDNCGSELDKGPMKTIESSGTRSCVSCGRPIEWNALFCKYCGHGYEEGAGSAPDSSKVQAHNQDRTCVGCGRTIDWDANVCQYCGYDFRTSGINKDRSSYAVAGGTLVLLVGIAALIISVLFWLPYVNERHWDWYYQEYHMIFSLTNALLVISIVVASILAILGGIAAIVKKEYPLALIGAIFGLWSGVGTLFFGLGLSIPGLILIIMGRHAFQKKKIKSNSGRI